MNALILAHPSMSAVEATQVARETGLDLVHNAKTGNYRLEQKRKDAISYLRERNLYILDQGSTAPPWGTGPRAA